MNKNQRKLIEIISSSIQGKRCTYDKSENINWDVVLDEAKAHDVQSLLYLALKDIQDSSDAWRDFMSELKLISIKTAARSIQENMEIAEVLQNLRSAEVPVIALKGIALRKLYPYQELRTMGDIDLLVPPEYAKISKSVIEELGYYEDMPHARGIHLAHKSRLLIELHWELLDQNKIKCNVADFEKDIWNNKIAASICDADVFVLGDIDQMLYLCFHMATHFIHGGFGLRQLCDYVLFTKSVKEKIEWEKFWDKAEELGIASFATVILMICNQFFGLGAPLPSNELINMPGLGKNVINEIMRSGTFGMRAIKWKCSLHIYFNEIKQASFDRKFLITAKSVPVFLKEFPYYIYAKTYLSNHQNRIHEKLGLI